MRWETEFLFPTFVLLYMHGKYPTKEFSVCENALVGYLQNDERGVPLI